MNRNGPPSDLERTAAEQLAASLKGVSLGSPLAIDSSSDLCFTLELLLPEMLRRAHHEWADESIDGFFFSSAVKTGEMSADLIGTCVLMTDQTVTPFFLSVNVADSESLAEVRIRLGEAGSGPLGISGPKCTSPAAQELLSSLNDRLAKVRWTYDVAG